MALQNTDDKKDEQDQQAPPAGTHKDADAREGSRGERLLDQLIFRFGAEPEGLAKGILQLSPSDRDDVMQVIHHRFGNGFVHQIEIAIGKLNQEREGQTAPDAFVEARPGEEPPPAEVDSEYRSRLA